MNSRQDAETRPARRKRGQTKGRQVDAAALAEVRTLLGAAPHRRDLLLEFLHAIQDRYGHLAARHLVALAHEMKLAPVEVFEVASFYHHLDIVEDGGTPPPSITVRVCDSLTCELFGAHALADQLSASLAPAVRVQKVACVGRCDTAPVAIVGDRPVPQASTEKVVALVQEGGTRAIMPQGCVGYAAYRGNGGYRLLQDCVEGRRSVDQVISALDEAGLRGLGGAGFPAARKWRTVRGFAGPRLVAVNVDEGEPGTFKDRFYLERDPHRMIEGMLLAAWAVEARAVYVYTRDEYPECREILRQEIAALRSQPPCALPEMHLRRGAGAYICGEESAMIESIEGKRGMPRLRPPYVAEAGLFGRPTLEHNCETLHWLRDILERGPEWYAGHGRRGRNGLRSYSVSGRVAKPGVVLAPAGVSARELIDEFCGGMLAGHAFYAYLPGGASGGILPASLGDLPLDFDVLSEYGCFLGSAAIIVLSEQDRARAAAGNIMDFFAAESCGKCTPCRVGTAKAAQLMREPRWNRALLDELSQTMADASICGLGQAAPNPIRSVIRFFPHEIE
ncbi:MAG TPA: NADH-ubiquinone oxidoreductase-F iron-sulfur binding region domain-containing protein [Burkholderiales bacterium]|nr:NADH-ubiquinone oxidoreductase-F iron-sulfur binding region domain-containing protein [Burkholderiales bacterium]